MAFCDSIIGDNLKLEGNPNCSVWSFKMRNMISGEDIWKIVDCLENTVAPIDPTKIAALRLPKQKAMTMIALFVKDNVIPYISSIIELDECWKVLKNLYVGSKKSRKLLLRCKLSNLNMEEDNGQFFATLKGATQ